MKIWAHRGASAYAPENTLSAFRLAVEMGADGVELDVHLSRDGEVVVCHDETVDRTSNGKGRILDHTLLELKELDFSYGKAEYRGERLPTLAEVYALLKDTRLTVNVELKTDAIAYADIEAKCLEIAARHGMTERVLYSSFNHDSLDRLRALAPEAPTGLLYSRPIADIEHYALSRRAAAIHPQFKCMYKGDVLARVHAAGLAVHPWTVDAQADMLRLKDLGADALITNVPDQAIARLRG